MDKNEVLAKSRAENAKEDEYEKEVAKQADSVAVFVQLLLATVFVVAQIMVEGKLNWSLYAFVWSVSMSTNWVKWAKLHRKQELRKALAYTLLVAMASGYYLYALVVS